MTEATTAATETTTTDLARVGDVQESRAVTVRERLISSSSVAIWDTAALEHMGRVGAIMADSGLMSETFMKDGDRVLERPAVVARCVMVANLAREVGANPLMFLQVCSIISRKLHIEGKAVNAIIRARTGVNLKFRFGKWVKDHVEFPPMIDATNEKGEPITDADGVVMKVPDPAFFNGIGELLAVHVYDPEDPERFVEGNVALWKTDRNGSPWKNAGNWRRQMRYRGAPEWARAYEPGAILGIYSDADEDLGDDFETARQPRQKRDLAGRLGAGGESPQTSKDGAQGFDRAGVAEALGDKPTGEPAASENDQAQDAEIVDVDPEVAQRVQAARDAGETVELGHAEPGAAYLLAGDAFVKDRRLTYKDGVRFSTVGPVSAAKLKTYAVHAPEVVEPEAEEERPTSEGDATGTDGVQAAEGEPASPGSAEPASPSSPETAASSPPEASTPTHDGPHEHEFDPEGEDPDSCVHCGMDRAEVEANGEVIQEAEFAEVPDAGFLAKLRPLTTWTEIKALWFAETQTSDFRSANPVDQDDLRRAVWAEVERVRADHDDKVDHATDVSAFGLWMATMGNTRDDADAIDGTFATLKSQEVWTKLSAATQGVLQGRVDAKLKSIRGAA